MSAAPAEAPANEGVEPMVFTSPSEPLNKLLDAVYWIGRGSTGHDIGVEFGMALEEVLAALAAPAQGDAKVLAALVSQIEKCNPVDDYGHKFTMNAAYLAAKGSL